MPLVTWKLLMQPLKDCLDCKYGRRTVLSDDGEGRRRRERNDKMLVGSPQLTRHSPNVQRVHGIHRHVAG